MSGLAVVEDTRGAVPEPVQSESLCPGRIRLLPGDNRAEVISVKIDYPITFLYYHDLDAVIGLYRDVLGLSLARDQGWCKIFAINSDSYVGLVDERMGSVDVTEDKGVLLTLVVDDVDAWYEHLYECGVQNLSERKLNEELAVYAFFFEDPEGYKIEIQKFMDE